MLVCRARVPLTILCPTQIQQHLLLVDCQQDPRSALLPTDIRLPAILGSASDSVPRIGPEPWATNYRPTVGQAPWVAV
jgi:hypothetical protein